MSSMECLTPPTGVAPTVFEASVIIPAYREEARIEPALEDIRNTFDMAYGRAYELIVADDGSDDATREIAQAYGATVLALEHRGKGHAVRQGILHATSQSMVQMDADHSFTAESALRMLDVVTGKADIAIAVRSHGIDTPPYAHASRSRAIASRVLAGVCEVIAPTGVSDSQCGLKAYKGDVAHKLFNLATINGFAGDREILVLAKRAGYSVAEVLTEVTPMDGSKVHPVRDGIQLIRDARLIRKLHQ